MFHSGGFRAAVLAEIFCPADKSCVPVLSGPGGIPSRGGAHATRARQSRAWNAQQSGISSDTNISGPSARFAETAAGGGGFIEWPPAATAGPAGASSKVREIAPESSFNQGRKESP